MKSLSIVVPDLVCINNCKFCIAQMKATQYKNIFNTYKSQYVKRMQYARDKGIDTLVFTGDSEPQQHMRFINDVIYLNDQLKNPFQKIEIQTTGVLLDFDKLKILKAAGIDTISWSISSFRFKQNFDYQGSPEKLRYDMTKFAYNVKSLNMNLRISVNLTDAFDSWDVKDFFHYLRNALLADQVTLRKLFISQDETPQNTWIKHHKMSEEKFNEFKAHFFTEGKTIDGKYPIRIIEDMTVFIDENCMGEKLILRPDCHLYRLWDEPGSLVY